MTSPLDLWAQANHKKDAINLPKDYYGELVDYVQKVADMDVAYWEPRNKRMLESWDFIDLGSRTSHRASQNVVGAFSADFRASTNDSAQEGEVVEFNDGYLIVDKIVSMVSAINWGINVPAKGPEFNETAQKIEDILYWAEEELNAQHGLGLNSTQIRDEAWWAAARGWICGLITPNPDNPRVPWNYLLEDPLLVYPRYSRNKLVRVIHRYCIPVLEAREDYPQTIDFLAGRSDDDEVEITTYYDDKYVMTLMSNEYSSTDGNKKDSFDIQELVEHKYVDIDGTPINPWVIVAPRGTPARRRTSTEARNDKDIVSLIGLDVIWPVKDLIRKLERLASQLHTEVAKAANPPVIWYVEPGQVPQKLDLGAGATNFSIVGSKVEILASSAVKPDLAPLMDLYQDRMQRGSLPTVLYGQLGQALAGYAINLLTNAARDVLDPLLSGLQLYRQLRFRRMLEMYINIGKDFANPLLIRSRDLKADRTYSGVTAVDPTLIRENGVYVDVTFDDPLPQDKINMLTAVIAGVGSGILDIYDVHANWLRTRNPRAAIQRIAEDRLRKDPMVQLAMAPNIAEKSGDQELIAAVQQAMAMAQMQANQPPAPTESGGEGSPESPVQGLPPEAVAPNQQAGTSPLPANMDPIMAIINQLQSASAAVNAGNGAFPPAPNNELEDLLRQAGLG